MNSRISWTTLSATALLLLCACYFAYQVLAIFQNDNLGYDLAIFMDAARNFVNSGTLYDRTEPLAQTYQAAAAVFKFPPPHQLPLLPLLKYDTQIVFHCLTVFYVFLYAVTVYWMVSLAMKNLPNKSVALVFVLVSMALVQSSFFDSLLYLSAEIPFLFLIMLSFLLHKKAPVTSGFLVSLMALQKIYPGFMVVFFALNRQWKLMLGCLLGAACTVAISLVFLGTQEHLFYVTQLLPILLNESVIQKMTNRSLEWVLLDMGMPLEPGHVTLATRLVIMAAMLWTARKLPTSSGHFLFFAWVLVAMVLVLPNYWPNYFMMAIPALLALIASSMAERRFCLLGGVIALALLLQMTPNDFLYSSAITAYLHETLAANPAFANALAQAGGQSRPLLPVFLEYSPALTAIYACTYANALALPALWLLCWRELLRRPE